VCDKLGLETRAEQIVSRGAGAVLPGLFPLRLNLRASFFVCIFRTSRQTFQMACL